MIAVLSMAAGYILGSFPTAYIAGKLIKGVDVRELGSGNVGATNVVRTVGLIPGIAVFVLDLLKGLVASTVLPLYLNGLLSPGEPVNGLVFIFAGAAAIGGHIFPVFLRFKGGKGVATTAGVMAGLAPMILAICLVIWAVVFSIWKYVSLASIAAAIALPILAVFFGKGIDIVVFSAVVSMLGVFSHRSNIKRLIQGTETRIIKPKKS
jgi:acyl phosphate:glycerol-3-phosphate acyltransferase